MGRLPVAEGDAVSLKWDDETEALMADQGDERCPHERCPHERRRLIHTNSSGAGWSWCEDCGAKLFPPFAGKGAGQPSKHWP
jgi:hypothetical protein